MAFAKSTARKTHATNRLATSSDALPYGPERRGPLRPPVLELSRRRLSGHLIVRIFRLADIGALWLFTASAHLTLNPPDIRFLALVTGLISTPALMDLMGAYKFRKDRSLVSQGMILASALGSSLLVMALVLAWNHASAAIPGTLFFAATLWGTILLGLHLIWWELIRHWRVSGRLTPNIVVVGATAAATQLIQKLCLTRDTNILGLFDDREDRGREHLCGVPVLGTTRDLLGHRILPYVDRLVISVPSSAYHRVSQLIETLRVLPHEIVLILDEDDDPRSGGSAATISELPLADIAVPTANGLRALVKRLQDVVLGLLALLLALPVMLVTMVAIKLDSPGPIFFRQRRHGFNNEEIMVWKFRSMRTEFSDASARQQVQPGDHRVTRVGRFIRMMSIDELPQIFNVLAGQMSLVGPRPHAIGMRTGDVESAQLVSEYAHRHRIKPGMTGWAAINGSRGPLNTREDVERRVALDVEYIRRQSLWLDLWIMLLTIPVLVGDTKAIR